MRHLAHPQGTPFVPESGGGYIENSHMVELDATNQETVLSLLVASHRRNGGETMTFSDLVTELDKLSRAEKLRVIQHLAHELEVKEAGAEGQPPLTLNSEYEIWSPQDAGGAVETLHKLLQEHQQAKNAR